MQENKRYCEICENAHIITTQETENIFYCCSVCRNFENENGVEIRENTFDESKVIDYCN